MQEIISKRTYTSKHFNVPGGVRSEFYTGHIHYKDDQGDFQDVDYSVEDMGSYWRMTKANYRLYVNKQFADPVNELIRFVNRFDGANHTIKHEPHSIQWVDKTTHERTPIRFAQNVTGTYADGVFTWIDAFGNGINYEVTIRGRGFLKEIVVPNKLPLTQPANKVLVVLSKYSATGLKVRANDSAQDWDENSYYDSEEGFTIREQIDKYKTYIKKAYVKDSSGNLGTNRKECRIYWEKRDDVFWQGKVIPFNWIDSAVYPIRADSTYYSDTGGDGWTYEANTTWAAARGGAGDFAGGNDNSEDCAFARYISSSDWRIVRGFYPFDTSALPATATITAATFSVYGAGTARSDSQDLGVNVSQQAMADPTSIVAGDYDSVTFVEGCDTRIDVDSWANSYNDFTLNSVGRGWIGKGAGAWTKLCLLEGHDIDNSAPDGQSTVTGIFSDNGSNEPKLVVTWTYKLTAGTGTYAVTGQAMTPKADRKIVTVAGTYATTGVAMTPLRDAKIGAAAGTYAVSGQALAPKHDKKITCAAGTYAITGQPATLDYSTGAAVYGDGWHLFLSMMMN